MSSAPPPTTTDDRGVDGLHARRQHHWNVLILRCHQTKPRAAQMHTTSIMSSMHLLKPAVLGPQPSHQRGRSSHGRQASRQPRCGCTFSSARPGRASLRVPARRACAAIQSVHFTRSSAAHMHHHRPDVRSQAPAVNAICRPPARGIRNGKGYVLDLELNALSGSLPPLIRTAFTGLDQCADSHGSMHRHGKVQRYLRLCELPLLTEHEGSKHKVGDAGRLGTWNSCIVQRQSHLTVPDLPSRSVLRLF